MRPHMRAISIEHHDLAALPAIDHEILREEPHADRPVLQLAGLSHHEPAAREGEFTQTIFRSRRHQILPKPGSPRVADYTIVNLVRRRMEKNVFVRTACVQICTYAGLE